MLLLKTVVQLAAKMPIVSQANHANTPPKTVQQYAN